MLCTPASPTHRVPERRPDLPSLPVLGKIVRPEHLGKLAEELRLSWGTFAFANGCFDLLHVGHIRMLQHARKLADALVVGINSDDSIRRLKGSRRPILPQTERAEILAALECVSHVVIFDEDTPVELVKALQPHVLVKGSEYGPHGRPCPEAPIVAGYGGRVEFFPLVAGRSTTLLWEQFAA